MNFKKIGLIALGIILIIALAVGWLVKQANMKAALVNDRIIEENKLIKQSYADDRAAHVKSDKEKLDLILTLKDKLLIQKAYTNSIVTKKDNELKALRFTAGTWEERYNRLEPECLQLSAKITAQEETIDILHLTVKAMEEQKAIDDKYIVGLEIKYIKCQKLLDISIANTESILKRTWFWKLFKHIKVGPGGGFSVNGKPGVGVYLIWAIN